MSITRKAKTTYVCTECGARHSKWQGRCTGCGSWHTLLEEVDAGTEQQVHIGRRQVGTHDTAQPRTLAEIPLDREPRLKLPDGEMTRVLDGGLVPGSLVLLGGEPGIGKSTLLLQLGLRLGPAKVLYVTGEESDRQVRLRAERLPYQNPELYVLPEISLEAVLAHTNALDPELLIVDSIQTLYTAEVESAPGSVSQVRECASRLMRYAKESGVPVILVGHINKEGLIAGPKVLEHMVDVVLEFEGDRHFDYRIVRSSKNRFGATPELGVYQMLPEGLREVANPSELFLSHSNEAFSGVAIGATLQSARPLLIETQALVTDAAYGTAQRSATGFDLRRLHMLLAVLERKCGLKLGQKDVFVNLAGGIRLEDPALDLALIAAVVSSLYDVAIDSKTAFAAEVGLTGEVRPAARAEQRILEAEKMGFKRIFISGAASKNRKIDVIQASKLDEVFRRLFQQ